MTPRRQQTLGIVIIGLGVVAGILVIAGLGSWFALIAVFLGSVGGQLIGQAHARGKRQKE